jgi:hypothetical protein
MNKKLTEAQIDELFSFCKRKGVKHYDLQIELVDHLASSIEQRWLENPELILAEALPAAYKQFGINGFSKFQEIKEKALRKKYTRLQWQYIGEFYRLPKIILTIALSLSLYTAIRLSTDSTILSLIILGIYAFALLIYFGVFHQNKSQLELNTGKLFLQIEYLRSVRRTLLAVGFMPIYLLNITNLIIREFHLTQAGISVLELITSFLITFFVFILIAMYSYIPKRIKDDFTRDFPQFVKS